MTNHLATAFSSGSLARVLPAIILIAAVIYAYRAFRKHVFPDNFGIVENGMIYRSGQLYPSQVEKLIAQHCIRSIVHGHLPELSARDESRFKKVCAQNDVRMIPIIMPGDGLGDFAQFDEALEILQDPGNLPALVCCARGTHRTGAIIAAYRVLVQGWPASDALDEMERYRFRPRPHRYKGGEHPLVPHLKEYFRLRARGSERDG